MQKQVQRQAATLNVNVCFIFMVLENMKEN